MKLKEKTLATKLRKQGKSYAEILKAVPVSKGTLSIWLRDIKLTKKQQYRLFETLKHEGSYKAAKKKHEDALKRKRAIVKTAKNEAKYMFSNSLFLAGAMLYWAEGDKSLRSEAVKFSNSDPEMIALMMNWFRKICKVPEKKFRIAIHIHNLHVKKDVEKYWSSITNIPINQFHKTFIKNSSLGHRRNILYSGTCCIRVCNINLFYTIHGWKQGIIEILEKSH